MPTRSPNFRQLYEASELLLEKLEMLSPAQRQAFDEKFLISWIFHDFALEGTVLQGPYRGRHLNEMSLSELTDLLRECRVNDAQSASVLESWTL